MGELDDIELDETMLKKVAGGGSYDPTCPYDWPDCPNFSPIN